MGSEPDMPPDPDSRTGARVITDEIAAFLDKQRLGYVATIGPGCRPNVSPKGTITRWDKSTLIFADIRSPDTVRNIRENGSVEISSIDPVLRKGYLFEGTASVIRDAGMLRKALEMYKGRGIKSKIRAVVAVEVSKVSSVTSPLYDMGATEEEVREKWGARLAEP